MLLALYSPNDYHARMGTKANLVNQRFGKLLVLEEVPIRRNGSVVWLCQCDCGVKKEMTSASLVQAGTTTCGCAGKEDLTGKKFGRLLVIKEEYGILKIRKRRTWLCKCDCGNFDYVSTNKLTVQGKKSCGKCKRVVQRQDMASKKFGRLTVLEEELGQFKKRGRQGVTWKCKCECGNITYVETGVLNNGHTKSCGCGELENKRNICNERRLERTKNRDPRRVTAKFVFDKNYSDGDLPFEIFMKLTQQNCHYCNSAPSNNLKNCSLKHSQEYRDESLFTYNGLDRIDSNKPHDIDNLVSCCKHCNYAKRDRDYNEFVKWIETAFLNLKSKHIL